MKQACAEMAVELSAYFDGELAPDERAAVKAHLDDCPACREALRGMERLHDAFSALSAARPVLSQRKPLFQDIMAKLDEA
ncbi:MAG: zf-HC2 domain-containing protein [Candidatus Lambdaproteobacteria bacterium]|nr:zf-HC2 domain-containing protein [Candidatus Lambdaproteobacteria bacterium]